MFRQFNINLTCAAISFCTFMIIFGYRYSKQTRSCSNPETFIQNFSKTSSQTYEDTLLEIARMLIKIEMSNYNFSNSGVGKLEDMVIESGGTPVRSIVVSTWRSGSSFLGELISAVPGSFYSYEPLMMFGITQIREPPLADRANSFLKNILTCDYNYKTDVVKYFSFAKKWLKQISLNERFWDICKYQKKLCYDAAFTGKVCKLFPIQVVKLDRLRLHPVYSMLEDEKLNVKVVFLVRDPRGVMQSRRHIKDFCSKDNVPDCADTGLVCSDMVKDYKAAVDFTHKYPERVMVLRFEDLAFNIQEVSLKLLNFLRLDPTKSFQEFLETHTNSLSEEPYSTSRITKNIPFKWRKMLKFIDVKNIQEKCTEAMALWGYKLARNASHMASKKFNPLVAEKHKLGKYSRLGAEYNFVAFGVETLGPWGPGALGLFNEISKRLRDVTGDRRAGSFLAQRISLAIQLGNAASIFGTMPQGPFLDLV